MENALESKKRKLDHDDIEVIYPCDQCDYVGTQPIAIEHHKNSEHDIKIIYPCDKCEFVSDKLSALNKHKQSTHLLM